MADQGTNYFNGNMGTAAEQQAAAQQQQQQSQSTVGILAATSAAVHASFQESVNSGEKVISDQKYNTVIGGMLLYGFGVNAIMCFAFTEKILSLHPLVVIAAYLVGAFLGMYICRHAENPVTGFIGYNLIVIPMGLVATCAIAVALSASDSASIIANIDTIRYAFCVMGICMMLMIGLAQLYPQFFCSMGRMLFTCLVIGIIGEVVVWCLGATPGIFDFFFVGLFLAYTGYDWAEAQSQKKTTTNAVRVSFMLYVDLINLLVRLIRIFARNRD